MISFSPIQIFIYLYRIFFYFIIILSPVHIVSSKLRSIALVAQIQYFNYKFAQGTHKFVTYLWLWLIIHMYNDTWNNELWLLKGVSGSELRFLSPLATYHLNRWWQRGQPRGTQGFLSSDTCQKIQFLVCEFLLEPTDSRRPAQIV